MPYRLVIGCPDTTLDLGRPQLEHSERDEARDDPHDCIEYDARSRTTKARCRCSCQQYFHTCSQRTAS